MDEHQALVAYEHIARITGQMLAAAEAAQWDRLTALEQQCSALFAPLMAAPGDGVPPSAEYRRRKAQLIRNILADDAQIRVLVEPQLDNLSALLGASRQKQRLVQAYESDG